MVEAAPCDGSTSKGEARELRQNRFSKMPESSIQRSSTSYEQEINMFSLEMQEVKGLKSVWQQAKSSCDPLTAERCLQH